MINLCHKRKSEVILHTRRYIEQASLRSKVQKSGVDRKKILAIKRGLHAPQKIWQFFDMDQKSKFLRYQWSSQTTFVEPPYSSQTQAGLER